MDASIAPDETLAAVLGARARATPADRLLLDVLGGLLVAAAAVWAKPPGWALLASAAGCFTFYGAWAFAERRLRPVPGTPLTADHPAWRLLWYGAATLGLASFVLMLLVFLGIALGRSIS